MNRDSSVERNFSSDVDLFADSVEWNSSKGEVSEQGLSEDVVSEDVVSEDVVSEDVVSEDVVSERDLSEHEVSERRSHKNSLEEHFSDEAIYSHSDNCHELATDSELTSAVSNQVEAVRKDPLPSQATGTIQYKSFEGIGTQMTPEELSFFEKYQKAKDACPTSMKCTTCLCKLFLDNPQNIQIHPVLGVLLCKNCREFYVNTTFTKDIKGHDEYCRWCAEARAIIRCHTCSNVFCKGCLKRCLGHVPFAEVTGSKCAWNCLICNDLPLWAPRALARTVMSTINRRSCPEDSNDPAVWLLDMIDEVEKLSKYCNVLARKMRTSWCTYNKNSKRKSQQSAPAGKETDKTAVIGCCRQLRRAVATTHFNMKSLEKKMLTEFKKTYGTTADIDLHPEKAKSQKRKPTGRESIEAIVKMCNFTELHSEQDCSAQIEGFSPSFASHTLDALSSRYSPNGAISHYESSLRTKKRADVKGKSAKKESTPKRIKATPNSVEHTSDSILPVKSMSKTISYKLDSKRLDSDEPSTQDLNEKARRGLLKDSSDSDSLLSSDLDINLSEIEITSRVKTKSRNYLALMDDPKLKFECAVVINRITNANFTMAEGKPRMVGRGKDMDLQIRNPLNMRRRMLLESESETDLNSEKEENQRKPRSSIQEKPSIKGRSRIAEMWSSSSSSYEVETDAEMTAVSTFSTVPLIPDREDAVRQALLATSDSDTEIFTSDIENEEPDNAPIASMKQNPNDDDNVTIITKEKSAKTTDVIDLTSGDEGPGRMFTIETDKLLRMSFHDPDIQTKRFQKDGGMKMKVMKRGKKKRGHHSPSDSESSESEVEKKKLKKIRLSLSVVDGTSDDGDDDESDSESTSKSELNPQKKIADTTNSENSSNSKILNVSQRSETGGSKGRKAIRKIMADTSLTDETKAAAKEEENRKRRIAERQKFYNEAFVCSSAITEVHTNSLILDFDPVTKKGLVTVDKSLVTKLKLHQVQGVKFMWDACFESVERIKKHPGSGCILAHCMGLGKSLQVVTLVHTVMTNKACQVDRVLVVCPVNIIPNWVNEFKIWLGAKSGFNVYEITYSKHSKGASRVLTLDRWFKDGGVLIIGYAMYLHIVNDYSKVVKSQEERDLYARSLVYPGPQLVVCDEGHFLKNEKTATYEAIDKIATRRRIVLTGTPLQNNLEEYFCMVQFVKPNLLGTINEFKNRFANPIKNGQAADSNDRDVRIMKRRAHVLHKMLEDSVQRFDYRVLTPFLPPKHEYVISVKLSEIQIKMYQHYLEKHVKGAKNPNRVKAVGLFADFQELGRVWTHPKALLLAAINRNKSKTKINTDLKATTMDATEDHAEPSLCEDSDGPTCSDISSEKESALLNQSTTLDESSVATPLPWWSPFCPEDMTKMELGGKLVLLMDILHQCELIGDKVLVFSQSLVSLSLIEEFLAIENERYKKERMSSASNDEPADKWRINHDYFRLDGQTSSELRTSACNVFNHPSKLRARLFLISTKAGGIGINLIAANRVIIFDASWNPSHDVQSIFRVYRFGQQKPCYIYRFLAQGTMEEKIYDRQVTKLSLSCRVVDEQQIERHFNSADLKYLYLFEPDSHLRRPTPILPKDRLLAELIIQRKDWIVTYHEHDSLLENKSEEELTEVERKAAWDDFENEKRGVNMTLKDPSEFANMTGIANITEALAGRTVAGVPLTSIASLIYDSNPDITREDFHERLRVTVEQMEKFSTQQAVVASAFTAAAQRSRDSRSSLINQRLLVTNQNGSPRCNSPQQTELPGQSVIHTQVARNPGSGLTTSAHQPTNLSGSVAAFQNSNTGGDELSGPNDVDPVHEAFK